MELLYIIFIVIFSVSLGFMIQYLIRQTNKDAVSGGFNKYEYANN